MLDNSIKIIRENAVFDLVRSGISKNEAIIEADILIQHVSGLKKIDIISHPEKSLTNKQIEELNSLVNRRIQEKIPVQYLTNKAYFMGYEFFVNKNVLIPRPETEILVEETIHIAQSFPQSEPDLSIIDIGTGSGCIACILAKYLNQFKITASDISEKALAIAKENAKKLNVQDKINFKHSDIFDNIPDKFNIIVSNPPYIPIKDRETLQIEVSQHEPSLALFTDDEFGISFYTKLIEQSKFKLKSNGYLALEIGFSQYQLITDLLTNSDFKNITILKDYSNIDRIIVAKK